jgi:hypothetical protein
VLVVQVDEFEFEVFMHKIFEEEEEEEEVD